MARKKTTRRNLRSTPAFDEPWSRNEAILQNILGANNVLVDPQSRIEAILQAILYGTAYTDEPQSRMEELLLCILNGTTTDLQPISRNEAILIAKINGDSYTEEPQSRIEELLIAWLNAYIEKTVTGNPITVNDAVAQNVMALLVELVPAQDLHGYDNPWPAGGGKNLLNANLFVKTGSNPDNILTVSDETITLTWVNGGIIGNNKEGQTIPAGTYTISATGTNTDYVNARIDADDGSGTITTANLSSAKSFTAEKDFYVSFFGDYTNPTTAVFKIQIESGSTPTAWSPYSNICPITGHDEVSVVRTDGDGQQSLSLTIPLGQTVYGGTVDVTNGVLTVDKAGYAFNGTEGTWNKSSTYRGSFYRSWNAMPSGSGTTQGAFVCSHAGYVSNFNEYAYGKCGSDSALNLWVMQDPDATINDLKTFLAEQYANGTPVTVCYTLATPITVTLTPQDLAMLAGTNIIQSAEADDLSLTYKATN